MKLAPLRGPLVLLVLCSVPLLLWAQGAPLDTRFDGSFTTLTSIAVLCAFAGTSAFALNLALGARLRFVESLFGAPDLDEAHPDAARVRALVTDGAGAMPSFAEELTDRQIDDVAAFVSQSAGK